MIEHLWIEKSKAIKAQTCQKYFLVRTYSNLFFICHFIYHSMTEMPFKFLLAVSDITVVTKS
jgi:hypothetical protein